MTSFDLCADLSRRTGILFQPTSDTGNPFARSELYTYFVTPFGDAYFLEVSSVEDEIYFGTSSMFEHLVLTIKQIEAA